MGNQLGADSGWITVITVEPVCDYATKRYISNIYPPFRTRSRVGITATIRAGTESTGLQKDYTGDKR